MIAAVRNYFACLLECFGQGWNRFWFTPSDPLPLAPLRIGTGLLAFALVAGHSPHLETFFGHRGLVNVDTLARLQGLTRVQLDELPQQIRDALPRDWRLSYLDYMDSRAALWTAHVAGLAVLALYTAGFATRMTSVLALVVLLSYVHRQPLIAGPAEAVLAFLMFYLCFAPAGAYWSIDRLLAARRKRAAARQAALPAAGSWAATVVIRLIQIHLVLVYALSAIGKLANGPVWWNGEAVWWLMARPDARLIDLTRVFYGWPYLFNAWTHAMIAFQFAFAILIWKPLARPLLVGLSVAAWLSLAPISGLVIYCLAMIVGGLAFVSDAQWRLMCQPPAADG